MGINMNSSLPHSTAHSLRILPVRDGILLFELQNLRETLSLLDAIEASPIAGIEEIIPAARTLLIRFDESALSQETLIAAVRARMGSAKEITSSQTVEVPVYYDGEDLGDVAELLGMSEVEVIERHTGQDYIVAFTGFAPGFAYLAEGDLALRVPRRKSPRTVVPAGSVALAGEFSGVYPKNSPGGWQLIGRTPIAMFDLNRQPAALLQPGFRVRFRDIAKGASITVPATIAPSEKTANSENAAFEVLSAGLPALFQDFGRIGQSGLGVSEAGALDAGSFKLANRLVGNRINAPVLELSPAIFSFKVKKPAVIALTGAPAPMEIRSVSGAKTKPMHNSATALDEGDVVTIKPATEGTRSYLSVRGGFDVAPVLESVSRDTLAQIGPEPIKVGDQLSISGNFVTGAVEPRAEIEGSLPKSGETVVIDVVLGPRTDWFTQQAIESFSSQEWLVTPQSSRVGIRLEGEALTRQVTIELPSEATLHGAIQVPASGQPVLFLNDHPLTGGYPVIGNVAKYHLDLASQVPPGARIRFNPISSFTDLGATTGTAS
jgi:KipI family sensor histidine kinase inhibitor